MVIDHEAAIVELDQQETERYRADAAFKATVTEKARDLSDETGRTVIISDYNGAELDTVRA